MRRITEHRGTEPRSNRSMKSSLNPYCIEDIAFTAAEIAKLRDGTLDSML